MKIEFFFLFLMQIFECSVIAAKIRTESIYTVSVLCSSHHSIFIPLANDLLDTVA